MKKAFSFLAAFIFTISVFSQKTLANDEAHSRIQFVVTHLGINDITGNFNKANLTINTDDKNFVQSKLNFTVDVNSIDTHVEARDNHLKSADFFDAATFPQMIFVSTSITKTKVKNQYILKGDLTMHGVTKPVVLSLVYKGSTVNPMSKANTYAYQVKGNLKRSDFGVGTKFSEAVISNAVQIKGDFELTEK